MTLAEGYKGKLYRALNPVWAKKPLSGKGAARHGGRFNARGTPALYCSLSPVTALREANQVGDLQPTTLVSYDADIERVFDTGSVDDLAAYGMSPGNLASLAWRDDMIRRGSAKTQDFAKKLIADGFAAILVRSFARGAGENDFNLVLWKWGKKAPHRLTLIDDEDRLGGKG